VKGKLPEKVALASRGEARSAYPPGRQKNHLQLEQHERAEKLMGTSGESLGYSIGGTAVIFYDEGVA